MRIDEIHIYGFGKFKDFKLNFSDNFNLIFGENENGKTTIAEFIKMMFYGNKSRNNDVFTNPRTKYRPLDGGTMAGSITFFHEGTRYRLEREFKGSNATDKITLHNLDFGESTALSGKDEIGEKFFSLNFGAFEKSVFIANSVGFSNDPDADGAINTRLSNMNATGDEDISYETVVKRITSAMEEIKTKTGRGGALVKLDAALVSLNEEAAKQKEKAEERDELGRKIESAKIDLQMLSNKKRICFEKLKNAEKAEVTAKLKEFINVAQDYEKLEKEITLTNGVVANQEFCDNLEEIINKCERTNEKCNVLSDEVQKLTGDISVLESASKPVENADSLNNELKTINSATEQLEREKEKLELEKLKLTEKIHLAKPKFNLPLLIIGCVLSVLSVIFGLLLSPYIFGGAVIGVVLFALSFILKVKPNTAQTESELSKIEFQLESTEKRLNTEKQKAHAVTLKINELAVKTETGKSLLQDKKTQVIEKRTQLLSLQNENNENLKELFSISGMLKNVADVGGAKQLLRDTKMRIEELSRLQVAAEYAAKGTNCKNLAEAREKLAVIPQNDIIPQESLEVLREELKQTTEEHSEVSHKLAALEAEARTAFTGLRVPAEFEREKKELLAQIDEQKEYYDALSIALEGVTAAFGEIRRNFSGVLEARALELLSGITNGKYHSINVSKNFDISVSDNENFGTHGLEHLSKGAMHQAYFSLRLALSELMGKDAGGLPVILDDAFSQYDDVRLLRALEFLYAYSKSEQVIFFTCHNDCKTAAQNVGAKIINL